jgi:hypothetical protein
MVLRAEISFAENSDTDVACLAEDNQTIMSGKYSISRPTETRTVDSEKGLLYRFTVSVIDNDSGLVVREFEASDSDDVQAGLRAVDEMLAWLRDEAR